MLIERTLFGVKNKIHLAIELLQKNEPKEGYHLAFSGGKDSVVILDLVKKAGVKYIAQYGNTTIDPPPLLKFIKNNYPEVVINNPKIPFLQNLKKYGFPSAKRRWCCKEYKEIYGKNEIVITGIRAEESNNRSKRKQIENGRNNKKFVHPIFYWREEDVWEYIYKYNIPYCKLYKSYKRIGCLFCPLKSVKYKELDKIMFPKMYNAFENAFIEMYKVRKEHHPDYKDGEKLFEDWFYNRINIPATHYGRFLIGGINEKE